MLLKRLHHTWFPGILSNFSRHFSGRLPLGKQSWLFSVPQMQSHGSIRIVVYGVLFLILTTKNFILDSFLVISNISEQLFQGTPSDGCFLKVFFLGSSRPKVLEKLLWKIWEISEENVRWDIHFFIFSEQNHSTTRSFLRIL